MLKYLGIAALLASMSCPVKGDEPVVTAYYSPTHVVVTLTAPVGAHLSNAELMLPHDLNCEYVGVTRSDTTTQWTLKIVGAPPAPFSGQVTARLCSATNCRYLDIDFTAKYTDKIEAPMTGEEFKLMIATFASLGVIVVLVALGLMRVFPQ